MSCTLLNNKHKVAVALSGGKDSTALLHYIREKAANNPNINLWGAIIINHNMRPESHSESEIIKKYWQTNYNIKVHIISYRGQKKLTNQKSARNFRLESLSLFAIKNNITTIFLGHNLEDKIETYLLRKEKQSTFWGLSSIGDITQINNITFVRPFLHTSRAYIDHYIKENSLFFIEDSSNNSDKYRRNYIRHHIYKTHNPTQLLQTINHNVNGRKKYAQYIKTWMELHLIPLGHFSCKFMWNRLPQCTLLHHLIIAHIVHLIRGKPMENWQTQSYSLTNRNFHIHNVTFNFQGNYCYAKEHLSDHTIYRGKYIFFYNKLLLYSNKSITCYNLSWPIISVEGNTFHIDHFLLHNVMIINDKKITIIIIKNNFFSTFL